MHKRLIDVAGEYAPRGVSTLFIHSNDAERYPADSLERCERGSRPSMDGAYLPTARGEVARSFRARTTPDVFVVDSEMRIGTAERRMRITTIRRPTPSG